MSQSRILSFFTAVPDLVYESQLERDRQQHSVDRESAQVEQALRRVHTREQQERESRQGWDGTCRHQSRHGIDEAEAQVGGLDMGIMECSEEKERAHRRGMEEVWIGRCAECSKAGGGNEVLHDSARGGVGLRT
jgi:hypothetical protein